MATQENRGYQPGGGWPPAYFPYQSVGYPTFPQQSPDFIPVNTPQTMPTPISAAQSSGIAQQRKMSRKKCCTCVLAVTVILMAAAAILLWYFLSKNCIFRVACDNGSCISTSQWCDGVLDCPDGEDEIQCARLYGPDSVLQVYSSKSQSWNMVCADGWDDNFGRAACQQIGYDSGSYVSSGNLSESASPSTAFFRLPVSSSGSMGNPLHKLLISNISCSHRLVVTLQCIACGQRVDYPGSRIVGGTVAKMGSWPWQVSLQISGYHVCGGSIITPYWIVTAAHCVEKYSSPNDWTVYAGYLTQAEMERAVGNSVSLIVSNTYDSKTKNNDIAMMQLTSPLTMSDVVRPVCLPSLDLGTPQACWITGWGSLIEGGKSAFPILVLRDPQTVHMFVLSQLPTRPYQEFGVLDWLGVGWEQKCGLSGDPENWGQVSQNLMEAEVSLIDRATCNQPSIYNGLIMDTMICAGYLYGGVDTCQGDSGGPLVAQENSRWWLVGDTSWGSGCANADKPGVYGNVTSFLGWIYKQMQKYKL